MRRGGIGNHRDAGSGPHPVHRGGIALYESLGFEHAERFRAGFTEDSVFMVRELTSSAGYSLPTFTPSTSTASEIEFAPAASARDSQVRAGRGIRGRVVVHQRDAAVIAHRVERVAAQVRKGAPSKRDGAHVLVTGAASS